METTKKKLTEQEAYVRLANKCAAAELCKSDIRRQMAKWDLPEGAPDSILDRLEKEHYVDENRYAQAFARDKFLYNHWGWMKIEMELKKKGIPQGSIEGAKSEISEDDKLETLKALIEEKKRTVTGKSLYEIRCKLYKFAMGKGFSFDEIQKVVGDLDE